MRTPLLKFQMQPKQHYTVPFPRRVTFSTNCVDTISLHKVCLNKFMWDFIEHLQINL